jgi:dihydrolipoamide dehydrogenase
MRVQQYDLAVIGGGPGGYVAAIKGAQSGKKVCLIEQGKLGGVCLNEGCIPTKTFLKSVGVLNMIRKGAEFGVAGLGTTLPVIDLALLQQRKRGIIKKLGDGVAYLLKGNGVTLVQGQAALLDRNHVKVGDVTIRADNIIIATGSRPVNLPIPQEADAEGVAPPVLTSKEVLEMTEVPPSAVIVGGGVIGIEFAFILAQLGAQVTVIEMLDQILPMVDGEITEAVAKMLQGMGIEIFTGARVSRIVGRRVYFAQAGKEKKAEGAMILMAVGRKPQTDGLNLEALGIRMKGSAIDVNEHLETSVPGIYAIGDVNGLAMLAHTASREALVAVAHILGRKESMQYGRIPWAIYLQPEIASVGLTEKEARETRGEIKVGRFPLAGNGKALIEGETSGFIKVITDAPYHEILGVHIFGPHATDMISEAVLAMDLEATAEEIGRCVHPHPSLAEIIPEAFHVVLGKAIHSL